jgi:hypothetical protein
MRLTILTKRIINISGITGVLLLIIRLLGIFIPLPYENLFLIAGLIVLFVICLPLLLVEKNSPYKSPEKYDRTGSVKKNNAEQEGADVPENYKGWGINDSPFRTRKSGVTWGGGNIKASNAQRGTRRRFLKK